MTNQEMSLAVAQKVNDAGGKAYYVGGYVRDQLLHRENKDYDIEIHGLTPKQLEGLLSELGQVTSFGESFGVYGLRHYDLDIAMPRKEKAIGRGHRDFEVTVDPFIGEINAARRRDFTINAMMQNVLTGEIVDYYHGREDLEQGLLRHVCDESFAEDPLRVLRGAQFAARFGFRIADETRAFCQTMDLTALAPERIFGELEKALLKADKPSVFFEELRRMKQLSDWFPEVERLQGIPQNPAYHPEGNVWNHTMEVLDRGAALRSQAAYPLGFMLACLCHDFGKITATRLRNGKIQSIGHEIQGLPLAEGFLTRITKEEKLLRYVRNMVELHMRPNMMADSHSHQKKFMKMFDLSLEPSDLLLLAAADGGSRHAEETEEKLRTELQNYRELQKTPPLAGADLIKAGYRPSPKFSKMLAFARELWLAGIDKETALKNTMGQFPLASSDEDLQSKQP